MPLGPLAICMGGLTVENEVSAIYEEYPQLTVNVNHKRVVAARNGALVYPPAILGTVGAVIIFLLVMVIPKFIAIFASNGMNLPILTEWVFTLSDILRFHYLYLILPLTWLGIMAFEKLRKKENQIALHRLLLKIPTVRSFEVTSSVAALLLEYEHQKKMGVNREKAYERALAGVPNFYLRQELGKFKKLVGAGEGLSLVLSKVPIIPSTMVAYLAASEKTEKEDELTKALAEIYCERALQETHSFCSIVEPTSILLLGLSVGTMIVACYLPIFKVAHAVSQ